tara:strand:+ start:2875 stop:3270 length:396 start_codon:yes stop_codon:yes gene_type:complete
MAQRRSKLKGKAKKIGRSIAKLYEAEVIRQDLIDTGLMRDSFTVSITVGKNGEIDMFVSTVFYFEYIDGSPHYFKVAEKVFESKKFKTLEDRLLNSVAVEFALTFPDNFDTSDTVEYFYIYPSDSSVGKHF